MPPAYRSPAKRRCPLGNAPSNVEYYQPALDVLWNTFGADRLVYGSNWPVSARFAPLATVQQIAYQCTVPRRT